MNLNIKSYENKFWGKLYRWNCRTRGIRTGIASGLLVVINGVDFADWTAEQIAYAEMILGGYNLVTGGGGGQGQLAYVNVNGNNTGANTASGAQAQIFGLLLAGHGSSMFNYLENKEYNEYSSSESGSGSSGGNNRITNPSKSESSIWKGFDNYRDGIKTSGSGKNKRYYEWDYRHNDIEVYDSKGNHMGSADPSTGNFYKPGVDGRILNL